LRRHRTQHFSNYTTLLVEEERERGSTLTGFNLLTPINQHKLPIQSLPNQVFVTSQQHHINCIDVSMLTNNGTEDKGLNRLQVVDLDSSRESTLDIGIKVATLDISQVSQYE
jgi:hypothetical protein